MIASKHTHSGTFHMRPTTNCILYCYNIWRQPQPHEIKVRRMPQQKQQQCMAVSPHQLTLTRPPYRTQFHTHTHRHTDSFVGAFVQHYVAGAVDSIIVGIIWRWVGVLLPLVGFQPDGLADNSFSLLRRCQLPAATLRECANNV